MLVLIAAIVALTIGTPILLAASFVSKIYSTISGSFPAEVSRDSHCADAKQ